MFLSNAFLDDLPDTSPVEQRHDDPQFGLVDEAGVEPHDVLVGTRGHHVNLAHDVDVHRFLDRNPFDRHSLATGTTGARGPMHDARGPFPELATDGVMLAFRRPFVLQPPNIRLGVDIHLAEEEEEERNERCARKHRFSLSLGDGVRSRATSVVMTGGGHCFSRSLVDPFDKDILH